MSGRPARTEGHAPGELTKDKQEDDLSIAFTYGGRIEIASAVK